MGLFNSIFGGGKTSSQTFIAPWQAPFLERIAQQGGQLYGLYGQQQRDAGMGMADTLTQQGMSMLGGLTQAGQGVESQYLRGLANTDIGGQAAGLMTPFMGQGYTDQAIGSLTDNLNRNLDLGLNAIQNRFGQAGTMGTRANIAGAQALGDTQRALASGISGILTSDLARQQAAASNAGNMLLGGFGMQTDAARGLSLNQLGQGSLMNQGFGTGLGMLPSLFGTSQMGFNNLFSPLGNFQASVGGPIILSQGSGSNTPGILSSVGNFMGGLGSAGFQFK